MVQARDCGYFRRMTTNFPPIILGPLVVEMMTELPALSFGLNLCASCGTSNSCGIYRAMMEMRR